MYLNNESIHRIRRKMQITNSVYLLLFLHQNYIHMAISA